MVPSFRWSVFLLLFASAFKLGLSLESCEIDADCGMIPSDPECGYHCMENQCLLWCYGGEEPPAGLTAPPTVCNDALSFMINRRERNCAWVASRESRCNMYGEDYCPVTCDRCEDGTTPAPTPEKECVDDESFMKHGKVRTCNWVGRRQGRCNHYGQQHCPVTCNFCVPERIPSVSPTMELEPPVLCKDLDDGFLIRGKPRTCTWVGQREIRCTRWGKDTCPVTCGLLTGDEVCITESPTPMPPTTAPTDLPTFFPTPAPTTMPGTMPTFSKPCHGPTSYIGDGYCDSETNFVNCGWDGGDCCVETCVDDEYECGDGDNGGFECRDPDYSSYGGDYGYGGSGGGGEECSPADYIEDGYCDPELNRPICNWDGGDCCEETCSENREYECGDNGFDCRNPEFSNHTQLECLAGGSDLVVNQDVVARTISDEWLNADDVDPCYIEEGCLAGTGDRHLLRFSSRIANIGCDDFYIGTPPEDPDDEAASGFVWHTCHAHWHYEQYAYYSLNEFCDGKELAWETRPAVGHKNGWCVMDLGTERGLEHVCNPHFDCEEMGISAGCWDEYDESLDCQWIDITDISSGTYWLMVATNWNEEIRLPELNYTNNAAWVAVEIVDEGDVRALSEAEVMEREQACPTTGSMGKWHKGASGLKSRRL